MWKNSLNQQLLFGKFKMIIKHSKIYIKFLQFSHFHVIIERKKNIIGTSFLAININTNGLNTKNLTGLSGDIGKKKFKFFNNIQNTNKKFVRIDKQLRIGKNRKHKNFSCILLNVNNLISPNEYLNYVS